MQCLFDFYKREVHISQAANSDYSQVIEYLSKKGYSRTEAMLRTESAYQDAEGRTIHTRLEDMGGRKYGSAFGNLNGG